MSDTPYESYTKGDDATESMALIHWCGQTFTLGTVGEDISHNITSVELKLKRTGSPGICTVGIYATDVDGKPTGSALCSTNFQGNDLPTSLAWHEETFSIPAALSATTKYAIVLSAPNAAPPFNNIQWAVDGSSPTYGGGSLFTSIDAGSSWTEVLTKDAMFVEYGLVGGQIFYETPSDSLSIGDSVESAAAYKRTPGDTLSLGDALASVASYKRSLGDGFSLSDVLKLKNKIAFGETLSISDELDAALIELIKVSLSDTLTISDLQKFSLKLSLEDQLSISDKLGIAKYLTIDDILSISDALSHQFIIGGGLTDLTVSPALIVTKCYAIADDVPKTEKLRIWAEARDGKQKIIYVDPA